MWSHELQGATTVYLDPAKKFSAATTAYLELHSNKKDQDLKVGTLLTLEGGVATIGLVNVRYLWESGGRSSFLGSTFVVGLTIARPKIN